MCLELEIGLFGHSVAIVSRRLLSFVVAFGRRQAERLDLEFPSTQREGPVFSNILVAASTAFV